MRIIKVFLFFGGGGYYSFLAVSIVNGGAGVKERQRVYSQTISLFNTCKAILGISFVLTGLLL